MTNIFTIGYEGIELGAFLDSLHDAGVELVIDVRELPLSRRKGFSKTLLAATLERAGIGYTHERKLGAPKPIRHELRKTGDYKKYFRRFNAYLQTQRDTLKQLVNACSDTSVVLMCFEMNAAECHRSVVARELGKIAGLDPIHLQVRGGAHHGRLPETSRLHTGQGIPAA